MPLKKAKIEVLDGKGTEIEVLFNPSQYKLKESASYAEQKTSWGDSPILNYKGGKASTLSMELFFDTGPVLNMGSSSKTEAKDVSTIVQKFSELIYIDGSLHAPPQIKFIWGSLSFRGVVTDMESTYTKFTEDGKPIQARVTINIKAAVEKGQKRKSPFESPDRTKYRTVREDLSIWDIARNEYGDMSKWKVIAKANGVVNPLNIPPGTVLKVPAL